MKHMSGNRENSSRLVVGSRVSDRDKAGTTSMVVVDTPEELAAERDVPGTGQTVADFNQEYPADSQVVTVVFENNLRDKLDEWESLDSAELRKEVQDLSIREYDYPEPRLIRRTASIPDQIETYDDLICYQHARLIQLASGIPDAAFLWKRYNQLKNGEIEMASVTKENKYQLQEDFGVCIYCKEQTETTFDHIIPVSEGGADTIDNQVPACQSCNSSKGNRDVIEWCKERNEPVPRIVWGKYLKQYGDQLQKEGRLEDTLPDAERKKWEDIELQRNITKRIRKRARNRS